MERPTRIYLTGFMGCGKSTIGPMVANVLGYGFIDLDAAIEAHLDQPIATYFAEAGEVAFRAIEADLMRQTGAQEQVVVALGGGALTFEENLQWALAHGLVVYLRVPADQLIQRLQRGKDHRPMLFGTDGQPLSDDAVDGRINALLARREPYYERAQVVVDVGRSRVGTTVDRVVTAIRRAWRHQERRKDRR